MSKSFSVYVHDHWDYHVIDIITDVISLVWVERYNDVGDFVYRVPFTYHYYEILKIMNFISIDESDRAMIIENIELGTDEGSQYLEVSGRSFEKILGDRITHLSWPRLYKKKIFWQTTQTYQYTHIWRDPVTLTDYDRGGWINGVFGLWKILPEQTIESGLFYNMIGLFSPDDCPPNAELGRYDMAEYPPGTVTDWNLFSYRFHNLHLRKSNDPAVTKEKGEWSGAFDDFETIVTQVTKRHNLGFRIVFDKSTLQLYFELYAGKDRTETSTDNIPVIFSNDYQNLISSKIYKTSVNAYNGRFTTTPERRENSKNTVYNVSQKWFTYVKAPNGYLSGGWNGSILYEVNTDVSHGLGDRMALMEFTGVTEPDQGDEDYENAKNLFNKAVNEEDFKFGREHVTETMFEAEVDPNGYFKYDKDYFLGDMVTIRTDYGVVASARVVEVTRSWDSEGHRVSPVFEIKQFAVNGPVPQTIKEVE